MSDSILNLKRGPSSEKCTIGELYDTDGTFLCFTLEDVIRSHKIPGQTAIPAGKYEVIINWSERFSRPMPLLLNVPFFQGIRIHPGNTDANTEGCILVGRKHGDNAIWESQLAFESLFPMLRKLLDKGKILLKIEGGFPEDRWERGMT